MEILTAFVARSFHEKDEMKLAPLLRHLASIEPLFLLRTAARSDVESVSEKVKIIIDECPIFIGILTKRYPILQFPLPWSLIFCRSAPDRLSWTAPPWVLQELGYAVKGDKKCILFIEPEVEPPGIVGDLEYIEYVHDRPQDAFRKANEMINKQIAQHAGMPLGVPLHTSIEPSPSPEETESPAEQAGFAKVAEEKERPSITAVQEAMNRKVYEKARMLFEEGLSILEEQDKPAYDLLSWKCRYFWILAGAGRPEGLNGLRELVVSAPNEPFPKVALGFCLASSGEHQDASDAFIDAAVDLRESQKTHMYRNAASSCIKSGEPAKALIILKKAFQEASEEESKLTLLNALYNILQERETVPAGLGVGELSLHLNAAQADHRFKLGHWYEELGLYDFGLFHFDILTKQEESAGALHNLALAYSQLDSHITAVSNYKQADRGSKLKEDIKC